MALGWATEDDDGDSAGAPVKQAPKGKVDFNEVRKRLAEIDDVDELNKYWFSLKLTDKQAEILKPDFADRKADIGVEA